MPNGALASKEPYALSKFPLQNLSITFADTTMKLTDNQGWTKHARIIGICNYKANRRIHYAI